MAADGVSSVAKRRRPTNPPTPRKKVRISGGAPTSTSDRRRRKCNQQTLTQIDFVKSSTNSLDDELSPCGSEEKSGHSSAARPRARQPPKRDSTLTQMDFFGTTIQDVDNLEENFLQDISREDKSMTNNGTSILATVHLDSVHSPSVPRLSSIQLKSDNANSYPLQPVSGLLESINANEGYTNDDHGNSSVERGSRRRSKRLAAATSFTTPASCDELASGTAPKSHSARDDVCPQQMAPGAIDLVEQQSSAMLESAQTPATALATPTKQQRYVPSSQSPESISKRSMYRGSAKRQPLGYLSTNVRRTRFARPKSVADTSPSRGHENSPQRKSPQRKVSSLKIPPRKLPPTTCRDDDSQHDVWSILPTSSSQIEENHATSPCEEPGLSRRANEIQTSLEDLGNLLGIAGEPHQHPDGESANTPEAVDRDGLAQDDPAGQTRNSASLAQDGDTVLPATQAVTGIPDSSSDEVSEFGSPVANDTQYVRTLDGRMSSPSPNPKATSAMVPHALLAGGAHASNATSTAGRSVQSLHGLSPSKASPLPPPRLVEPSPNHTGQPQQSARIFPLPTMPSTTSSVEGLSTHTKITQVPLNDTVSKTKSSSSPVLPHIAGPISSSMNPAEMPRPSQLSTQAPSTQGFFHQFSPGTQTGSNDCEKPVDRVTIGDSSSMLSPKHPGPTLTTGRLDNGDVDELLLVEDSEEDLDLDPLTWRKSSFAQIQSSQQPPSDEITQTPTQKSKYRSSFRQNVSSMDESPVITKATTRAERDAQLEVIDLLSQPGLGTPGDENRASPEHEQGQPPSTVRARKRENCIPKFQSNDEAEQGPPPSSVHSNSSTSVCSPSPPPPLKRKYSPIAGFDNDTQNNYTQNGHITAAYIHRMREEGLIPDSFVPNPYKPKSWNKSFRSKRQKRAAATEDQNMHQAEDLD